MTDHDTDRLLLEKAAKATGLTVRHDIETVDCLAVADPAGYWGSEHMYWNPLTDDGDALRLVVKLELNIEFGHIGSAVLVGNSREKYVDHGHDVLRATRRAIMRAAAALGGECAS